MKQLKKNEIKTITGITVKILLQISTKRMSHIVNNLQLSMLINKKPRYKRFSYITTILVIIILGVIIITFQNIISHRKLAMPCDNLSLLDVHGSATSLHFHCTNAFDLIEFIFLMKSHF